eukprot:COSAG03_NODE_15623_length_425_cov_0.953988_1_plen_84_part_00
MRKWAGQIPRTPTSPQPAARAAETSQYHPSADPRSQPQTHTHSNTDAEATMMKGLMMIVLGGAATVLAQSDCAEDVNTDGTVE